jgi:hypothetical protein
MGMKTKALMKSHLLDTVTALELREALQHRASLKNIPKR